jgi:hypothetical protein
LSSLLPEYPEIGGSINYNQELKNVERGIHRMKDDILCTHDELEGIFNTYDTVEDNKSSQRDEDNLDSDISKLLKSKFFNKK